MRFADPLKKIFALVAMMFITMPLSLVAQDDKKPDEKKSRRIGILIYMNTNFEITSIYENP